jgi:hypothetical protein
LRHFDRAFAVSNQLRTEGTDHLIAAARAMGVKRFVAQSFCGWPYARTGGAVKSEDDPLDPELPKLCVNTTPALACEAVVATSVRVSSRERSLELTRAHSPAERKRRSVDSDAPIADTEKEE